MQAERPLLPDEALFRLNILKSFANDALTRASPGEHEISKMILVLAEKFAAAIARLQSNKEKCLLHPFQASSAKNSLPAPQGGDIYDECISALRNAEPAFTSLSKPNFTTLLALLPYLTPDRTINLSAREWTTADRCDVLPAVSFLIRTGALSFPYKRFDFRSTPAQLFAFLQKYEPFISHHKFSLTNHRFKTRLFPFTFDDKPTLLMAKDEDYELGDKLVDYYQEDLRMRARRADEPSSPLDYWLDRTNHPSLVEKALKHGALNARTLREAMYESVKECTQFRPSLAVSVLRFFAAKRVLDFSAGWGDRLVAAIAAGVERYVGVDPNSALKPGHDSIMEAFCPDIERRSHYQIIYEPFEKASLPAGTKFDLVFTSPPFFNFEIYSMEKGQSVQSYPRLNDWLVRFLFCSLRKSWASLCLGGHMVIHLADVHRTQVCEAMNMYCQSRLSGATYRGLLACSGSSTGKPRPMWVWRRDERSNYKRVQETERAMARLYPELQQLLDSGADSPAASTTGNKRRA